VKRAIGVMARAPVPGRCKKRLLAAHPAEWVTGLYAAMLRDTLDGLQSVLADDYLVFVAPIAAQPGEESDADALTKLAFDVLSRHVPAPWTLVPQRGTDRGERVEHALSVMFERGADYALVSGSDAPSVPTDMLAEVFADDTLVTNRDVLVGPSDDGGYYAIGMSRVEPRLVRDMPWSTPAVMETTRLRCRELGLTMRELPKWYDVDEPSDVRRLLDEMRTNPERAPRTAQFLVKNA
jgi:rSAM/selenodomain-associated transferase 1